MTLQRLQVLFLTWTLLAASPVVAQSNEAPVVNECWPHSGSANAVIELRGFRIGPDDRGNAEVLFIQNGIEIPARTSGGMGVTNDRLSAAHTLKVIVPEEVVIGPAQIVAVRNGFRSAPVTFTIAEWTPPVIRQIIPTTGPPGTTVAIECENLHTSDEIELTDAEGRPVTPKGGAGYSAGTAFSVPDDFPEGVLRIRIGNLKFGKGQFTPPVEFIVTNEALTLQLVPEWIKSVAPGQWIDLQASSRVPLEHSEQTDVFFKQAGREIIVTAPRPQFPRVEVPRVLTPGEVEVQVRTWRHGRSSLWSTPVTLQLLQKPLPPYVQSLRHVNENGVQLWPGPDRATRFNAAAGDLILIHGLFPVASPDKLKVLMARQGQVVELAVAEVKEQAEWYYDVGVRLPADMPIGNWQMIVRAVDGTEHLVPIPIRILPN